MSWNMAPEAISSVVICIIWIYARKGNPIPTIKNHLFQTSLIVTFASITSNIVSTLLIYTLNLYTLGITFVVTTFYFLVTPLMGMVYFFYSVSIVYEGSPRLKLCLILGTIPGGLYVLMVLLNVFTKNIFSLTMDGGYVQGKSIVATYLVFYLYCLMTLFSVLIRSKSAPSTTRLILLSFPIIAAVVIIVQMVFPSIVLTGSAATCSLLIIYLYLQNKQISIDYLTHLPNRQEFLQMLNLATGKSLPFTVLVVSLRDFKRINDTFGQNRGDAVLAEVGDFMRRGFSKSNNDLYRYSGDEFALILYNASDKEIRETADLIQARMAKPWHAGELPCMLSAGVGTIACPTIAFQTEKLINGIEYTVLLAKTLGDENFVCHCTPELLLKAKRRQDVSDALVECLAKDAFEVHYQPVISVESGEFVMAEALLRINDSPIGRIFPDEFIPIAEESGMIIEITYMVLDKVCKFIRDLMENSIEIESISVNFSALQFVQPNLYSRVTEIIEKNGVPYSKIKIELTERTLADNTESTTELMNRFHELGMTICLDDFGTGYSNLISVIDLPIDIVKLDRSLIWAGAANTRFSSAVKNMSNAFHDLNMLVLAEGVETKLQSDFSKKCGCEFIQGFLYAKPMSPVDFKEFILRAHKPI